MKIDATSQKPSEATMQKRTLVACLAVAMLNCLILALLLLALVGNRALRLELKLMAIRLAALEEVQLQPPQAQELK